MERQKVLAKIDIERDRQEQLRESGKFAATCATEDLYEMTDPECFVVLGEEFGEVGRAVCDGLSGETDIANLCEELVQVAAVCVAWLERIG